MTTGLQLGRPGVYPAPGRADDPLSPVRLDITGFVGVALRGPVDRPVPAVNFALPKQKVAKPAASEKRPSPASKGPTSAKVSRKKT